MNKKCLFLLIFTINICVLISANDFSKSDPKTKFEPFFNISNALVKFTGNQGNQSLILESPYLIGVKYRFNNKNALRFGTDFNLRRIDENLENLVRSTSSSYYSLVLGYERRYEINKKFDLYYGMDIRYFYEENNTDIFEKINKSVILNKIINVRNGPGVGAHFGFVWNITPRLSLFTESSVNFFYYNQYNYLINGQFKTVIEDKVQYNVIPYAPNSLFFLIKI